MGFDQIYSLSLLVSGIGMKAHTCVCVGGGSRTPQKYKNVHLCASFLGQGLYFLQIPKGLNTSKRLRLITTTSAATSFRKSSKVSLHLR